MHIRNVRINWMLKYDSTPTIAVDLENYERPDYRYEAILAAGVEWMWLWEEARGGWVRYTARDFHLATLEFLGLHTTIARAP